LTHLHCDHAGNLDAFPNARIFVQRYEYESWKTVIARYGAGGVTKDRWVFSSLDADNFRALDAAVAQGRVQAHDRRRGTPRGLARHPQFRNSVAGSRDDGWTVRARRRRLL